MGKSRFSLKYLVLVHTLYVYVKTLTITNNFDGKKLKKIIRVYFLSIMVHDLIRLIELNALQACSNFAAAVDVKWESFDRN